MIARRWIAVSLSMVAIACGGDDDPTPDSAPSADTLVADLRGVDLDELDDAGRPGACAAQDEKLRAALDGARTSPNALLVIRNAECGTSVYVSGDTSTATEASLWRIGSVTKTFTASTIIALTREGELDLDDPLSAWVPDVPNTEDVTVRMLLNHTSGIYNFTNDPRYMDHLEDGLTPEESVAMATAHPPYFAPGEGWEYSNTNYILLGMIIEKAGSATAAASIRELALEPAGLESTFLEGFEPTEGTLARGFDSAGNDVTELYTMKTPWTAGSMVATGADLCDWIYTLYGTDAVLTSAEREEMLTGVQVEQGVRYGLGVMVYAPELSGTAGVMIGHGGDIFGYHTEAFYFPSEDTAICVVVNQDYVEPNEVGKAAASALF